MKTPIWAVALLSFCSWSLAGESAKSGTVPPTQPVARLETIPAVPLNAYNASFTLSQAVESLVCRGDANCDGFVNFGDVNAFVLALSDFAAWRALYPNCPFGNLDLNGDGKLNFGDIGGMVSVLLGGGGPCP